MYKFDSSDLEHRDPDSQSLFDLHSNEPNNDDLPAIDSSSKISYVAKIKDAFRSRSRTDIEIIIGDRVFKCHQLLFLVYSGYFQRAARKTSYNLTDSKIAPEVFEMVYEWMLADVDEAFVPYPFLIEFYQAAVYLDIESMKQQCYHCLNNFDIVQEDNAFLLYLKCVQVGVEDIKTTLIQRICKFFLVAVASVEFVELSVDEVKYILSMNTIGVNLETEVFFAAVRWLCYDWEERSKYRVVVMEKVRFCHMPILHLTSLQNEVEKEDIISRVCEHQKIKEFISNGLRYCTLFRVCEHGGLPLEDFRKVHESVPVRHTIFDPNCKYHHTGECRAVFDLSYTAFKEHLYFLQRAGFDYFKNVKIIDKNQKICLNPSCQEIISSLQTAT